MSKYILSAVLFLFALESAEALDRRQKWIYLQNKKEKEEAEKKETEKKEKEEKEKAALAQQAEEDAGQQKPAPAEKVRLHIVPQQN